MAQSVPFVGIFSLTNALRRIRNAWHLHHALILVIKVVRGSIGFALLTT
ncbi:DUF3265 domain-containing protein [Vibrio vulnificus]|nr:DUF3265 domain-containing protein [Vibrio vulnificus]MCU8531911.1 DUF3265 domain-containing protein [Vibrio vulnificus]